MDRSKELFLQALNAALRGAQVDWAEALAPEDWRALFQTADEQHVLPMILEAVYRCPAAGGMDPQSLRALRQKSVRAVLLQTMQTDAFLQLYAYLGTRGFRPLVVKGIVCRNLYPRPDDRLSGDEDLLLPAEQFAACHQAMLDYGMCLSNPAQDIDAAYEVPYGKPGSPLYIELHKQLFPTESDAYGDFNRFFTDAQERAVTVTADGRELLTLEPTDHLFYLLCHAFKHFLHSGCGIRQVCDICLFANAHGQGLDWARILGQCREIHAERFAAALFRIGERHLTFDPERACYPAAWRTLPVDEAPLLEDLLDAGVYGDSSMSRKHSSTITLNAVSAQKQGKKAGNGVLKTVFPSAKDLQGRYPYLKDKPWLLPAAWVDRILKYRQETSQTGNDDAASAVEIGNRRVELLREYGIVE